MEKVNVSVPLDKKFHKEVTAYCKKIESSKTGLIRRLLREHLQKKQGEKYE